MRPERTEPLSETEGGKEPAHAAACHPGMTQRAHQQHEPIERETHLCELADKLLFRVEKIGQRFTLTRTVGVSKPVIHEALTIEQAEDLLANWKLRGLGGG